MFRRFYFIVCLASTLLWGVTGTASSAPADTQTPAPALQTIYKTYAGVGFSPISSDIQYTVDGSEIFATNSPGGTMAFVLPLALPQGAEIVSVDYYALDNSELTDVSGILGYYNPETNYWSYQTSKITAGASANIQTLAVYYTDFTVDNAQNFYFLRFLLNETYTQKIAGARVGYTLASPPSGAQTITLGGDAFRPEDSRVKYAPTALPYQITVTESSIGSGMSSKLDLPVGTQITSLTYYVIDDDPDLGMMVGLYEYTVPGDVGAPFLTATVGASPLLQAISVPGVQMTIRAGFGYDLRLLINNASANLQVAGARLTYVLPPGQPVRTAHYIDGSAFLPDDSSIEYASAGTSVFQRVPYLDTEVDMGFSTPLDLPQGASITRMTCYAFDNDGALSHYLQCGLMAYRPADAARFYLYAGNTSSPGASSSIRELKAIDPAANEVVLVNNMGYQYRIWVSFDQSSTSAVNLKGVIVETGFQVFLPAVRQQ